MSAEPVASAAMRIPPGHSRDSAPVSTGWTLGLLHLALGALLLLEVALVRGAFDTDRFLDDERGWARLLLATRNAAPIGIATLAAWGLLGWRVLAREYAGLATRRQGLASGLLWLALHASALLAFWALTRHAFDVLEAESLAALPWIAAWGLGALVVPASAAAIAFPPRALAAATRRLAPSFLLALGLGLVAFALNRAALWTGLWLPLQVATTELASAILQALGERGIIEPFVLAAGDFEVIIAKECSGIEGIALTWTFLGAYFVGFRAQLRFPHALVLVPVATLCVWLLNGVRLAGLVWIGARVSPEVALEGFHSYAGWIVFCGLTLSVVHVSQRIPWFARAPIPRAAGRDETVNPAAVYLGPMLGILAASFLTGAFTRGFDAFYPLRVLVGAGLLLWARPELPRPGKLFGGTLHATGIAYGTAAFVLWIALERLGIQARTSSTGEALAGMSSLAAGTWLLFRGLGFLVVAPLAEELAFRGFLARRLVSAEFEGLAYRAITPLAWCLSSLAFGLLHGQWIAATLAGALYGLAAMRRGRLADAVVAHVTTNLLLLLSSLLLGPWHAWA